MSPEKIMKLRELAERGVGGEKQNAIDILTKHGIDWRKPKESIIDRVKQSVNMDIKREYRFDFKRSTDFLLLQVLCEVYVGSGIKLELAAYDFKVKVVMTPAQYQKISHLYTTNQDSFARDMYNYAMSHTSLRYR